MLNGSYCGPSPLPGTLLAHWNFDPVLIAALIGLMLLGRSMPLMERRYLVGAVAALAVAFVSPLCALSVALFSARAVHHLLLVGVAAPLLAFAIILGVYPDILFRYMQPSVDAEIRELAVWTQQYDQRETAANPQGGPDGSMAAAELTTTRLAAQETP